ncbi:rhodanese-like domain-containing protein [Microlunatus ginsengisoli]|uniref:rhodanese-like domain-containing protein n=1 Tax=Microlunatus ginsengisoli TaxID=363863 RepID=UPI0031DCCDF5
MSALTPPATTTSAGAVSVERPGAVSIATLLDRARAGLDRLTPAQAREAWAAGAVVVDIRPSAQRATHGDLPGALVIERNVLEWRFDPTSEAALPIADHDLQVILLCQEGYASSLAAATLQELGLHRATDVVGGYAAWQTDLS